MTPTIKVSQTGKNLSAPHATQSQNTSPSPQGIGSDKGSLEPSLASKEEKRVSHSGITSEVGTLSPFTFLSFELIDRILSYIKEDSKERIFLGRNQAKQAKVRLVCQTFNRILAPYYSLEEACKAGPKFHNKAVYLACYYPYSPKQAIIYAGKAKDTILVHKMINDFTGGEDYARSLQWIGNYELLKGLPFPIASNESSLGRKIARCKNMNEAAEVLIADPLVDPAEGDNFAIRFASELGYTDVVKTLLKDSRVDPSVGDNYPLRRASLYGYSEIVTLLLTNQRVDPSAIENAAIQNAVYRNHADVVATLLKDPRVDPTCVNYKLIKSPSKNVNIVRHLLNNSRMIPTQENTKKLQKVLQKGIEFATNEGYTETFECLLTNPLVNPCANDHAIIKRASLQGCTDIVKLLLQDPRVDPAKGLNKARKRNHLEIVLLLEDALKQRNIDQ